MSAIPFLKDLPIEMLKQLQRQEGKIRELRRLEWLECNGRHDQADRLRDYYVRRDAHVSEQLKKIILKHRPELFEAA